ncbi:class I SAM-dependent methyltransferase [Haloterrigena salifodinae]|uniref:Class I SAM-dependent methyltransferase n=1 Tax=Haloterrigena salifodinae TaxID=2675099 RepID=A0A8T8E5Z8_9EURY|nr:class I SAM-dependent methyltransferase [Haloterrigena salifodinae]QRV17097.1 class I SAM-dependent methyltransferase [Haloterrigena salifodinae]
MDRERTRPAGDRDEMRAMADPLGRAMLAHHRDEPGELVYRDGPATQDGNVESFYFSSSESWDRPTIEALERLADREPILDVGCGAGNHLLWWADHGVRAVGVDASPNAVLTARQRGFEATLVGDMFALPVPTDAFGAVHAVGTQLGLGGSLAGIRELLWEFARVTADEATAVVDNHDPTRLDECFGYRSDPREGIAHRCFHLEFERDGADGERYREVGRTLHFLLCSPVRLREATAETPWRVGDVLRANGDTHYRAVLEKAPSRARDRSLESE